MHRWFHWRNKRQLNFGDARRQDFFFRIIFYFWQGKDFHIRHPALQIFQAQCFFSFLSSQFHFENLTCAIPLIPKHIYLLVLVYLGTVCCSSSAVPENWFPNILVEVDFYSSSHNGVLLLRLGALREITSI